MPAGTLCPCPHGSRNPGWSDDADEWITGEVVDRLPGDLPDDTVLVGIIDTGIALGHRAFRRANGSSRVISAWQQTALYRNQPYLPFGEEWYAGDIDGRLRDHSRNRNPMDRLDEDGFNRAMRLVEPGRIRGHRDLDHRAAHGTHVMDIAAGFDPSHPDADRVRMIVVNLPTQYLHGSAGNFLSYFAAYAVERVFHMAEALWTKNNPSKPGGALSAGGEPGLRDDGRAQGWRDAAGTAHRAGGPGVPAEGADKLLHAFWEREPRPWCRPRHRPARQGMVACPALAHPALGPDVELPGVLDLRVQRIGR